VPEFYLTLMRRVAERLKQHLFPGDGLAATALLLCAQIGQRRKKWLAPAPALRISARAQ